MASRRKLFEAAWWQARAGRLDDADQQFKQILQADPKHFLGHFGRLFVLHARKATPRIVSERARMAKKVLSHAPAKPSTPMEHLAMRYATNTLADGALVARRSLRALAEGLRHAELGARYDAEYDDTFAPVTATKCELLIALGREEEAYPIIQRVLDAEPTYAQFQAIKRTPGFKRWSKRSKVVRSRSFAELLGEDLATDLNCAMLAAVEPRNRNRRRAPMDRSAIERLRLQATRGSSRRSTTSIASYRARSNASAPPLGQ
jgi:tetratricopeptide (TPR) repeat protein